MKSNITDPYQIARENNVIIIAEPLANIHGYYNNVMNRKFIHVSETIPEYFRRFVVAHLLYGVIHNPDEMMFLYERNTFTKTEIEANKFAHKLLHAFELEQLNQNVNSEKR